MTQEEKAKAYDKALERAEALIAGETNTSDALFYLNDIKSIFPELKESEDERIRKEILEFVTIVADSKSNKMKWVAWLEKQGEQKSIDDLTQQEAMDIAVAKCFEKGEQKLVDKVETKFKVGDWVVWDNKIYCHVDNIYQGKESLMYTITDAHNMTRSYSVKGFDNNARLWTIADAKEGDILVNKANDAILIFKSIRNNYLFSSYCDYFVNTFRAKQFSQWASFAFIPATREQCELLFSKMKGAGYKWNTEKKELCKIEQEPKWTKEDDKTLIDCYNVIHRSDYSKETRLKIVNWIKSLKKRIQ